MHRSGILIMVLGLALGVTVAFWLSRPGETSQQPDRSTRPPETIEESASVPALKVEAAAATPPAEGQQADFGNGWTLHWQRGETVVSGWQSQKQVWSHELPFAVADVVRGRSENEVRAVSVDALKSALLDLTSGNLQSTSAPVAQKKAGVPGLLAEAKKVHARALAQMKAGDHRATLAECKRLSQLADQLASAKHSKDAFRIWAAAKKIRRAVAPQEILKPIPKEQQPRLEDLEF